jgi:hypothetical protein
MPRRQFARLEEQQSRLRLPPRCVSLGHTMAGHSSSLDRVDRPRQLLPCRLQRLGALSSSFGGELRLIPLKNCTVSCSLLTLGRLPEKPPKLCDRINRLLLRAATSRWHPRSLVDRDERAPPFDTENREIGCAQTSQAGQRPRPPESRKCRDDRNRYGGPGFGGGDAAAERPERPGGTRKRAEAWFQPAAVVAGISWQRSASGTTFEPRSVVGAGDCRL